MSSFLKKLKYSYIFMLILLFFCGSTAFADYDAFVIYSESQQIVGNGFYVYK